MFDLTVEDRAVPQSPLGRLARMLNLDVPLSLGLLHQAGACDVGGADCGPRGSGHGSG